MVKVNKVAHVVLSVKDPVVSAEFYSRVLGLEIVDHNRERNAVFLSFGKQHHDLALFPAPPDAQRGRIGINHIAFQLDGGMEELRQAYRHLQEQGVELVGTTDHTITKSIYFRDPDGNQLELYAEGFESPEEGLAFIRKGTDRTAPLDLARTGVRQEGPGYSASG